MCLKEVKIIMHNTYYICVGHLNHRNTFEGQYKYTWSFKIGKTAYFKNYILKY